MGLVWLTVTVQGEIMPYNLIADASRRDFAVGPRLEGIGIGA
jgi:hypothetical protein